MPIFKLQENIQLESGRTLVRPDIQYHSYGKLNEDASNVIWVCHALTGNSDVFDWWPGLFGEEGYFNPDDHFIICANVLGSHYGTTGPLSTDPSTGEPYFHDFPQVTIKDIVALHIKLANHLKIKDVQLLIGGSLGGHQALEWSIIEPSRIKNLCLVASSAVISPWAAAFNHTQRMAIENDPTWKSNTSEAGLEGMATARAIALLSYRNQTAYDTTQSENLATELYSSRSGSYQNYQGGKLQKRFNAYSYWHLAKAMDSHNVARGRATLEEALALVEAVTLVISIKGDLLFPVKEQRVLAEYISNATHTYVNSDFGHDGFLIEVDQIQQKIHEAFGKVDVARHISI